MIENMTEPLKVGSDLNVQPNTRKKYNQTAIAGGHDFINDVR